MNASRITRSFATRAGGCSCLALVVSSAALAGEPCAPSWDTTVGNPGLNFHVFALKVYDDGSGPALYVGGWFWEAGGLAAESIARWDGAQWSAVGAGLDDGAVESLQAFDDGTGPALYAGGWFSFNHGGGKFSTGIGKWNGNEWDNVGSGMTHNDEKALVTVSALAVYDDGDGPALYAGGTFHYVDGIEVNHIAYLRDGMWHSLDGGVGLGFVGVSAMAVFDDGDGPALYVGGSFTFAGGVTVNRLGKWDGDSWSDIGAALTGNVWALHVHDDGHGPALYVGGSFATIGGVSASNIAKYDGKSFSALGSGTAGTVQDMCTYDDGSGPALYVSGTISVAGGSSALRIAKWDGDSWSALGDGITATFSLPNANALEVFDDGSGPVLYAGGYFDQAGGETSNYIAAWRGCFDSACPSDFVTSKTFQPPGDGTVDGADLAYLLGEWGANPGSPADIVTSRTFQPPPDGVVDGADLAVLLGAWGPCS